MQLTEYAIDNEVEEKMEGKQHLHLRVEIYSENNEDDIDNSEQGKQRITLVTGISALMSGLCLGVIRTTY